MEIEYSRLHATLRRAFEVHGVEAAEADILGRELADATFAGYESHGIGRVKTYLDALAEGTVKAGARLEVVRETAATALLDAGFGFGVRMALEAADLVAGKAGHSGIGAAAIRNCGDVARLAPYAERIAGRGFLGLVMANDAGSGQVVAPHGGAEPLLSTNPVAAGIPRPGRRPIVFDMATSQIALGAVRAAARRREPVPRGTLVGLDGQPVEDPGALFEGLAALLPLGGPAFGFKGTALSLLVEALAGGLSGDGFSGEAPDRHGRNAVFMLALDPAAFDGQAAFHARLEGFLDRLRACRPGSATAPVRVPGEHGEKPGAGARIQVLDALWEGLEVLGKEP